MVRLVSQQILLVAPPFLLRLPLPFRVLLHRLGLVEVRVLDEFCRVGLALEVASVHLLVAKSAGRYCSWRVVG